jgi:KDO2-lipid IV(A) lauroyltransferase
LRAQNLFPLMNTLIYWLARALIACIQLLPLRLVARLGRAAGGLAFHLDARHRRVVLDNLNLCFGNEKSAAEIRAIAQENFRRIGENYVCSIKTAAMSVAALQPHVEYVGLENMPKNIAGGTQGNAVVAVGHFGNFEFYARLCDLHPQRKYATTYRGLKQPGLNRLMQNLRERGNCQFFERRTGGRALRAFMAGGGATLGLFSDQSSPGFRAPFLGHDCNTGLAPAVMALRYEAELSTVICYRIGLAKWRLELGEKIPTHENGQPRSSEAIMRDVNRAFEIAVRRDPANWFWVHRRWKD